MKPRPSQPPVALSVSQAAECFEHTRATIAQRIARANLKPHGTRRGYPVYRLRDLLNVERASNLGAADPDSMGQFERLAYFKAESERQKVNTIRAVTLDAGAVAVEFGRVLRIIVHEIELLIDEISDDAEISDLVRSAFQAKMRRTRALLMNELHRAPEDPEDRSEAVALGEAP